MKPMRQRVLASLMLTFFLGFPLAGLVFVWKYAHNNIEKSAEPVARQMAADILPKWDVKVLDEVGTLQLRKSKATTEFAANKDRLGNFVSATNWKLDKST